MIGRENEIRELRRRFASDESEFVAIYGRRRIGKTFLVNEVFNGNFAFHHSGMEKADKRTQLESFREALRRQGLPKCKTLRTWIQAFSALADLLESRRLWYGSRAWSCRTDGEMRNRFRLDTALVGVSYNIDIEDLLKCVRRCAEHNEVFVQTSHGIAPDARGINMKTEWF